MATYQLAQCNIARLRAPLDSPLIAGFVAALEPVNQLADRSPGFVWRLQTEDGDATAIRAFDDDMLIVNMSVWESIDALAEFAYRSGHRDIDLVVEREGTVAFVEVKARRGREFGDPVEAVNWNKQKQLARSASVWIDRHGRPAECYRFDVVGVLVEGDRVRVRHVANAFSLSHSA